MVIEVIEVVIEVWQGVLAREIMLIKTEQASKANIQTDRTNI
jgi:hypothetical protein